MLVVGEDDSPAFKEQTDTYGESVSGLGIKVVRTVVAGEDHFR